MWNFIKSLIGGSSLNSKGSSVPYEGLCDAISRDGYVCQLSKHLGAHWAFGGNFATGERRFSEKIEINIKSLSKEKLNYPTNEQIDHKARLFARTKRGKWITCETYYDAFNEGCEFGFAAGARWALGISNPRCCGGREH
jgi:hypothetical protein